jgi:hypothetical protein
MSAAISSILAEPPMSSLGSTSKRPTSVIRDAVGDAMASLRAWRRRRRRQKTDLGERLLHGMTAQEFMYCFESLGANCEFGIVQRRCGAEPLGPLRWAIVTPENLVRALEAGLKDLLDPELMEARLSGGRYVAHNRAYDITFGHSGFHEEDVRSDRVLNLIVRRLQLLARKLGAILANGEKIVVFRARVDDDDAMALRLGAALRRLGPNLLLWVAAAPTPSAAGRLEPLADDVLKGYIEADSDWDNLAFDTWLSLCDGAYGYWRAMAASGAARTGAAR